MLRLDGTHTIRHFLSSLIEYELLIFILLGVVQVFPEEAPFAQHV
jgi:hypothetical protein